MPVGLVPMQPSLQLQNAVTTSGMLPVHAGIAELVQELQKRQTAVYLVSGGFRAIINPIAEILKIPLENVYANTILHDVSSEVSTASWHAWMRMVHLLTYSTSLFQHKSLGCIIYYSCHGLIRMWLHRRRASMSVLMQPNLRPGVEANQLQSRQSRYCEYVN